ncbi:MAG: hypothetical protein JXL80_17340 [Planctomycetes bacterium]|nr:hypothetical protein [Planctomycetota bacterium]
MTGPRDMSTYASGREYSVADLMRIAWWHFTRGGGNAVAYAIRLGLIYMGLLAGTLIVFGAIGLTARMWLARIGVVEDAAEVLVWATIWPSGIFTLTFLFKPFEEGLLWAIVASFEGQKISWDLMTQPWQPPWRGPMLRYAALYAIAMIPSTTMAMAPLLGMGPALSGGKGILFALVAMAMIRVFDSLVLAATLLVGPTLMISPRPQLRQALRDQWRLVQHQTWRVVLIIGLWLAVTLLTDTCDVFLSPRESMCGALLLAFAAVCFYLCFFYLVAAVFRAIHGLPFERRPSSSLSPTVAPLSLGVMSRQTPDYPLPPIPFDDVPPPQTEPPQPSMPGDPGAEPPQGEQP